jgi:FkbM family methyltransferase
MIHSSGLLGDLVLEQVDAGGLMVRWWNVRRFDALELCLTGALVAFVTWVALTARPAPLHEEALLLERTYGSARFSENEEEWIIRDFFRDQRGGVFLDVGASHYQANSNTYFLERSLGWSGLAVEPFTHLEPGYAAQRPRTRFMPFFVSDVSGEKAKMYTLAENFSGASSDKKFVERFGKNPKEFIAPTITLNDLLQSAKVERIDFLSMDIELSEPKALAGFDIQRYSPRLVCIEGHPEVRQQILDYFARNRYVLIGKYLRADDKNLYFTPLQ